MRKFIYLSVFKITTSNSNLSALRSIYNAKINKRFSSTLIHLSTTMDLDAKLLSSARSELLQIFQASVASVMPTALIEQKVHLVNDHLVIDSASYAITENVYLVGFGKAVAEMAHSLEQLLGPRLKRGIVSIPHGSKINFEKRSQTVIYREGAENNQPDADSAASTELIVELVNGLAENDTLLILVSGGGSALLFSPTPPLNAESKIQLCKRLQNAGANIAELNHVRKMLSRVKGGGLARNAYPARVLALVLSDIVGNPIESIASGPTCPLGTNDSEKKAIEILKKYNLYDDLQEEVRKILSNFSKYQLEEKMMMEDGKFKHVENIIIGSNATALQAAESAAKQFDLETAVLTSAVEGDVKNVSSAYAKLAKIVCHALSNKFSTKQDFTAAVEKQNIEILNINLKNLESTFETLSELGKGKGMLLLAGGEPTVVVSGNGKGGRNQELALRFSLDWLSEIAKDPLLANYFVLLLSVGTDGQDGPTDAAGAFGYPGIRPKMMRILGEISAKKKATRVPDELKEIDSKLQQIEEMLPENVLKKNNSYSFYTKFENGRNLVKTGLTGTNVMDLHFIYIKKHDCECNFQNLLNDKQFLNDCEFLFNNTTNN